MRRPTFDTSHTSDKTRRQMGKPAYRRPMNIELVIWGAAIGDSVSPDWPAADRFIDHLDHDQLKATDIVDEFDADADADGVRAQLRRELQTFRASIDGVPPRELHVIEVRGLRIYFAGHEFGDGPAEGLAATMRLLGDAGVLDAAGFEPVP